MTSAPQVVFICEHGAAKSVLAATYFNHLAEQRGLSLRALARGTAPDSEIPRVVLEVLARDSLAPCTQAPTALDTSDVLQARQVISFDQPQVATLVPERVPVGQWDALPPVSADFDLARAAILARVQELITELEAREGEPG